MDLGCASNPMRVFIRLTAPAAVCLLRPLLSAKGAKQAGCGVELDLRGCRDRHLYSRMNFKLNRAAALSEWRQLLSAQIQATPAIRCECSFV